MLFSHSVIRSFIPLVSFLHTFPWLRLSLMHVAVTAFVTHTRSHGEQRRILAHPIFNVCLFVLLNYNNIPARCTHLLAFTLPNFGWTLSNLFTSGLHTFLYILQYMGNYKKTIYVYEKRAEQCSSHIHEYMVNISKDFSLDLLFIEICI